MKSILISVMIGLIEKLGNQRFFAITLFVSEKKKTCEDEKIGGEDVNN